MNNNARFQQWLADTEPKCGYDGRVVLGILVACLLLAAVFVLWIWR